MADTKVMGESTAAQPAFESPELQEKKLSSLSPIDDFVATGALTAARQVLEAPELLEMIISSLPPLEILVLQRVSHMWHGVTVNSPPIQRMLFLRPDWNLEAKSFNAWQPCNRPGERPKNNRMLRRVLDGMYPTVTLKIANDDEEEQTGVSAPDENSFNIDVPRKSKPTSGHWSWDVNITYPADKLPTTNPAVLYEKASWRDMFICQPPCTALHLVRRWQTSSQPAMQRSSGITMDFFIENAAKARENWRASDRDWHYSGPIKCSSIQESETRFGSREVVYDEWVLERLMGIGYLASVH